MFSFRAKDGTVFNYNSDLSGDVIIVRQFYDRTVTLKVNGADLLEFILLWLKEHVEDHLR